MTKPETDVNPGAGKPDDAGEGDEGAFAKDNEPVTESEKVSCVCIDGERKSRWCTENKLATSERRRGNYPLTVFQTILAW